MTAANRTPAAFAARLAGLNLTARAFSLIVDRLADTATPSLGTVNRWTNDRTPPVTAFALLTVMEEDPARWAGPTPLPGRTRRNRPRAIAEQASP